jgi:hypothetical protein
MSYIRFGPEGRINPTITGGNAGNAALVSLMGALASQGWVIDATTGPQIPNIPTSLAASSIGSTSFVANWAASVVDGAHDAATGYLLDVSTDAGFVGLVAGYNGAAVGNVTTVSVVGLLQITPYWYRVRATNPAGTSANSAPQSLTTTTAPATQTLTPTALATSTYLYNSGAGEYRWFESPSSIGLTLPDSQRPLNWVQLEPNGPGENEGWSTLHSVIDARLAVASANGGRYMGRMQCIDVGSGTPNLVPDWFFNNAANNCFIATFQGENDRHPDWNNNNFLTRMEVLFAEIARYVADKPAWGWWSTSTVGEWGEWHEYQFETVSAFPGPSGQTYMTTANITRLLNAISALHHPERGQFWVCQIGSPGLSGDTAPWFSMGVSQTLDGLNRTYSGVPVGTKIDSFGTSGLAGAVSFITDVSQPVHNRWLTAPFVTEFFGDDGVTESGQANVGETQTRTYHVSMIAGGELHAPTINPERAAYTAMVNEAGYRYQLDSVTLPSVITRGAAFTFSHTWENRNVAPTYDPWSIKWQLRNQGTGAIVWEQASVYNLTNLTDTSMGTVTINDTLTVLATGDGVHGAVSAGTYNVSVEVRTSSTLPYLPPMNLNISGRAANGSYQLGTVSVV